MTPHQSDSWSEALTCKLSFGDKVSSRMMASEEPEEQPWELTMQVTTIVRSGALVISFLLVVGWERRTWLKAEMAAAAGFGAAFLVFPNQMMQFQVAGELNPIHTQLTQMFGLTLLVSTVLQYCTLDTLDGTVPITLMMSRICTCGSFLLAMCYTHFWSTRGKKNIDWNQQHIYFGMLGVLLWLLGHIYHLLRSTDFATYPQYNVRINTNLHVEALLLFIFSLVHYAFPEHCVINAFGNVKIDAVHLHLERCVGCLGLGSALVALQATGFLHEHDKRYIFLQRLVYVGLSLALLLGQHLYFDSTPCSTVKITAAISLIPVVNALYGYFFAGTTVSYAARFTNKHD